MSATNGSNPRLDRIEKLIEQTIRASKEAEVRNDKAHAQFQKAHAQFQKADAELRNDLRRWASLGVKEARNQRKRMAESDQRATKLKQEILAYQRRTDQNLAEITDKLNGLIGFVAGR
jgi:hypothetical protein